MRERVLVFVLCFLAAIRVSIFLAAFPFFANVDEGLHFDLVVKYSHFHVPRGMETISHETARFLSIYNSPEFLNRMELASKPAWKQSPGADPATLPPPVEFWIQQKNFESGQMPLYYVLAGTWMRLGELAGLQSAGLLYWIRFLNVFIFVVIIWLSYVAARLVFPDQFSLRFAVPLLIAFIPQDAFYQIQNDVLAPLCFGILFLLLLRAWSQETPGKGWAAITGVVFAATYLTKTSNLPLLVVAGITVLTRFWQWKSKRQWREILPSFAVLSCCALIPVVAWTIWFEIAFGDATASSEKMQLLTWTPQPFWDWLDHPIFSPTGAWTFINQLMASFWRGEFVWLTVPLASRGVDLFYVISSIALLVLAGVGLVFRKETSKTKVALWFSYLCLLALIAFYVFLSVRFDFGTSVYPSRDFPYFASGRLMLGALIPFALLYIYGLDQLWRFTGKKWPVLVSVVIIASIATISEIVVTLPVFHSEFNWFHL